MTKELFIYNFQIEEHNYGFKYNKNEKLDITIKKQCDTLHKKISSG